MAKKPGATVLQVDIQTEEELDRFLENPGLSLLDVYSGWCGPCLGMVSTLRKAKIDKGGELLYLATCKSDNIDSLARFRNKSEPTWLFVYQGKTINIVFGAAIPKISKTIIHELEVLTTKAKFPDAVNLNELLPIEKERLAKIEAGADKERAAADHEIKRKRLDYLNYCTGEISNYIAGYGVTLFGPHITRDQLKKVFEISDAEKLSCKDRKAVVLLPEHIEVLNYACNNPINEETLEHMYNKEILLCYWKIPDNNKRSVEDVLGQFLAKITKPQPTEDGEGTIPPILQSQEVKVKAPKEEVAEVSEVPEVHEAENQEDFDFELEEESINEDEMLYNMENAEEMEEIEKSSREFIAVKKSSSFLYMVNVPAMWTPGNRKNTAAAIYVFFRNQTTAFLPPDPIPEPPHLIVVFDAWKRKDVTDVMNKFSDDILTYGYFSNEEPEKAELIANSTTAYVKKSANRSDKLVLKVAKKTSHAVLALASHGPTYVSPNTDTGKIEALHFFPEGYNNDETEIVMTTSIKTAVVEENPAGETEDNVDAEEGEKAEDKADEESPLPEVTKTPSSAEPPPATDVTSHSATATSAEVPPVEVNPVEVGPAENTEVPHGEVPHSEVPKVEVPQASSTEEPPAA